MVSQPQASRGRTVYSGGSFAPTRGPVSAQGAQGYLKREAGKAGPWGGSSKWGRDGKSDTRSGVAQRALQRRGGWGGDAWKSHYPGGSQQGNGPQGGNGPGGNGQEPKEPGAPVGAGAPAAPVPSVATPTVVVGDAGKLELPYDPSYGQDVYEALQGTNEEIAGIGMQEQAQAALYAQQQHVQGQQYEANKLGTLNQGGASGNLFSSGQGMAIARDAQGNQNALNQYANENNEMMTGLNTQRSSIQNAFKQFLSNRTLNYADDLSEDAGEIGFGADQPDATAMGTRLPQYPGRPKPKPKPKAKAKPKTPPKPTGHTPPRKPGQSPPNRPPKPGK